MCGLTGVLTEHVPAAGALRGMSDSFLHRGPDDGDVWMDSDAGIAWGIAGLPSSISCLPATSACTRRVSVIDLAALTDLEFCERERENAWLTNGLGAENLGLIASQLDAPYVYIFTAGIFSGDKDVYNDFDEPDPISCYAKAKYYGECFVRQYVRKHYVVRVGWMMGGGLKRTRNLSRKSCNNSRMGKKNFLS